MKSKITCKNCTGSFMIDEDELNEQKELKCPICMQPFDEKITQQLKNAFKTLKEYQK